MKKILLLSMLLNLATCLFAITVTVKGTIKNDSTQKGIANHVVYLHAFKINSLPVDSTIAKPFDFQTKATTDPNGVYQIVFDMPDTSNVNIDVYTLDCSQKQIDKIVKAGLNLYEINFSICDGIVNPPPAACKANFVYVQGIDPTTFPGLARPVTPFTYSFLNKSFLPMNSLNVLWNFGDSTTAKDLNVIHDFVKAGIYHVCLSITNGACSDIFCQDVIVGKPDSIPVGCQADFIFENSMNKIDSLSMRPALISNSFQFENISKGNITKLFWDFGDGNYSNDSAPKHTFTNNGVNKVCLFIGGPNCQNSICKDIAVPPIDTIKQPCLADFYVKDSVNVDYPNLPQNTFHFFNNSTGNLLKCNWDFSDGSAPSADKNPLHMFKNGGAYKVCLTVTGTNCNQTACQPVYVGNPDSIQPACHAAFYINKFMMPKDSVIALTPAIIALNTFNFVNVSSGNITSSYWDFGDGAVSVDNSPVHAFQGPGTYKVCLTINGNACTDFYCQTVFIGNSDSTLKIDPAIPDTIINKRNLPNIPFVDKLTSQLDSCIIDYQKPIESTNIDNINILDKNKAEITWIIKQYDTIHTFKVIVNFAKLGLTQFTLNLTCSNGNTKSLHSNTFVDSYDVQITGIKENFAGEMNFVIHPNPVTDNLSIDLNLTKNQKVIISVMNQFGQTIQSSENIGNTGLNRININANSLASGIYFVQIKNDQNKYITKKFVKIK